MRLRLSLLFFLQFAVWGSYQTSLGTWLSAAGRGADIGYFYSVQGLVAIFMPTLMGLVADRLVQCQRLLALSHAVAAAALVAVWRVALDPGASFAQLFVPYTVSVMFFMPTIGLSLSVAYVAFSRAGADSVSSLPPVRMWGTVGFIVAMLLVDGLGLQAGPEQLLMSAGFGLALALYALTLPACPVSRADGASWTERLGLDAFGLLAKPRLALFFLFSMLLGVALQITNGYAGPYLQSFARLPDYADAFAAAHPNVLISLSQLSETLCILLIPWAMRRAGIKGVMLIAMCAWVLRFGFLAAGSPGWPGIALWTLSMVVYGVAFDFFNISGSLFVEGEVAASHRASAQGLFLLMVNGLGAGLGTLGAQAVVNSLVYSVRDAAGQLLGWRMAWGIFAAYAAVVALAFSLVFRGTGKESRATN